MMEHTTSRGVAGMSARRDIRRWTFGFASLLTAMIAGSAHIPAGAQTKEPVTFSKDIAPILQRSCQQCHRPNSVAPMSLLTYEQVRPYARAIKTRTGLRNAPGSRGVMPPWFI